MSKLHSHLSSAGKTQAEFAAEVGTSQATISRLCGESPMISLDLAQRIERASGGAVPVLSWPKLAQMAIAMSLVADVSQREAS